MSGGKRAARIIYDVAVALAILTSIALCILDYAGVLGFFASPWGWVNLGIYIVLWIDYIVRFCLSEKKSAFFKRSFFDLLSILPFSKIFCFLRLIRFASIIGARKLFDRAAATFERISAFFERISDGVGSFMNTNGFLQILYAVVLLIFVCSFIVSEVEGIAFGDALWWAVVTCTTVGYGDITPSGGVGKGVAVVLMIVGVGLMGVVTGTVTSYFQARLEKKRAARNAETQKEESAGYDRFKEKYDALSESERRTVDKLLDVLTEQRQKSESGKEQTNIANAATAADEKPKEENIPNGNRVE